MDKKTGEESKATGFTGLGELVSDVSADLHQEQTSDHRVSQTDSSESKSGTSAHPRNSSVPSDPDTENSAPGRSSGFGWAIGIAVTVLVLFLIGNLGKQSPPISSPTFATAEPPQVISQGAPAAKVAPLLGAANAEPSLVDANLGVKPPVGEGHVLNHEQIRYCLGEKIRLDVVDRIANQYVQREVDQFNLLVHDYNVRCGSFKYRKGLLERVQFEVEQERASIESSSRARWVKDLRLANINQATTTTDNLPASKIERNAPLKAKVTVGDLTTDEQTSLEAACNTDKYVNGPAAYNRCIQRQLTAMNGKSGQPETSHLTTDEKTSLEAACNTDKYVNGPAAYNRCLQNQLAALKGKGGRPDSSHLTYDEQTSLEAACNTDKYVNGPSAYNNCLRRQLAALNGKSGRPDISRLTYDQQTSIESACNTDKYVNGPAAYNQCLRRQMSKLR